MALALCALTVISAASFTPPAHAAVGINHTINFQGKLVNLNGTNVTDGSYSFVFTVYDAASAGVVKWTETKSLTLLNGVFQTALGDTTALPNIIDFNTDNIFLGIKVGADAEMTPRVQFGAVAQAFNSERLSGLTSGQFVQLAQGVQADASATQPSIFLNKTGATANVIELQRAGADVLVVDTNGVTTLQGAAGNNATLSVKQASTATSGDIFNVTGSNGTSKFIQVTSTGANVGAVTVQSLGANALTLQSGSGTVTLGSSTALTATAALTVSSGGAGALTLSSGSGTISAGINNFTTTGGVNAGAVTITTGNTFTNASSTLNTAIALADIAAGGNIGTAAATVDVATSFTINQTTAGQTLTIPSPTVTTAGRIIYISNIGTASFTMLGSLFPTGSSATFTWNGTAWKYSGSGGSAILNQNTANQTANFQITGTGQANTSFLSPLVDVATAGTFSLGTGTATAISIGKAGVTTSNLGALTVTQLGTFNGGLTVVTGATLTNASSTLNTAIAITDKPTGGALGTAAATVDVATSFTVNQTTAGQTLTIPSPTVTTAGRIIYISNIGTASFTMLGATISTGTSATLVWNGTAWTFAGADASSILNQNTANQIANFRITGSGQANTSFLSPLVDVATAGTFSLGTGTATAISIGKAGVTTSNLGALTVTQLGTFNGGLTVVTGATLTNASSTLNTAIAITDKPTGGALGTAAATVDVATSFTVNQTTAGQTLTIPSPTVTTAGRIIYISNIGTASFTMLSATISAGTSGTLVWNGTAWTFAGADASSILNQNTVDQLANFRINGTGAINGVATPATPALVNITSGGSLPATTTYYYKLAAINTAGASTEAVSSNPTNVTTGNGVGNNHNTLTWTAVTGAQNYKVYRSGDAGVTWFVNTVAGGITTIDDNGTNFTWATSGTPQKSSSTGGLSIGGGAGVTFNANNGGNVVLQGSSAATTSYVLRLPSVQGGANTVLQNDGAGNLSWIGGAGCSSCLAQVPTTTAQNTVSVVAAGVVGLTVNGTTNATSAIAAIVNQSGASDAVNLNLTNTVGTQVNAFLINRNGAGGTTTNALQIQNTSGTLTNGIVFSGTIGTDIATAAARGLTIVANAASTISTTAGDLTLQGGSGTVSLGTSTSLVASAALTVTSGGTSSLTVKTADSTTASTGAALFQSGNASTGANLSSGSATLDSGTKTGTGTSGVVNIATTNAPTLNIGSSTFNTNINVTGLSIFKPQATSTVALQIQNTSAQPQFSVDTTNRRVTLDDGQAALANVLVFDSSSAVPAAIKGAMYFDGTQFRCSADGSTYVNCVSSAGSLQASYDLSGAPATIITSATNKTVLLKAGSTFDANNLFQVQNSAGTNVFNVDTANAKIGTADSTTASTAALTIKSGDASTGTNLSSGAVTLDSGTATGTGTSGNLSIGTGAYAHNTTIGNATGTSTALVQGGTGSSVKLESQGTILIGNNAVAQTLTIGNGTGATSSEVRCGTGACLFGNNATDHATTIGSATGTSALNLNSGTGNINLQAAGSATTGNIQIGAGGAGSGTPDLLVLDNKNTAGDPTGTNGAQYYNSNLGKFRCFENSVWRDCLVTPSTATSTTSTTSTTTTATISGMTLTPGAGDYIVWFNAQESQLNEVDTVTVAVYVNAVQVASSVRTMTEGRNGGDTREISTHAYVTGVTAGQAIDIRWSHTGATSTMTNRSLILEKVGADLAEIYYTKDHSTQPGDVVSVDGSLPAGMQKSTTAYDSRALGIISTKPGKLLDDGSGAGYGEGFPVALSGRVPVKITPGSVAIEAGDYITTSSDKGRATKATQPGQVIGKALEGWTPGSGKDTVMVFVGNSWRDPSYADKDALLAKLAKGDFSGINASAPLELSELIVRGSTKTKDLEVSGNAKINALSVNNASVSGDLDVGGTTTTARLVVVRTATLAAVQVTGDSTFGGRVVVAGNADFAGDINLVGAAGQSRNAITKKFKASKSLLAGDVVIADPANDGQVTTTTTAADTKVLGIATADTAAGADAVIAIGGTVQVKSAATVVTNGDLLTSSLQEGMTEKAAVPIPGTIVGKALGKVDPATHLVWILVTLH